MTAKHEHTPTTEVIRETYIGEPPYALYGYTEEEFDRWLSTVEAAAEQRGAEKAIRRAEKLLKEDRAELGETVSVKLIIDWLRLLAGQPINNHRDQEGDDD